MLPDARALGVDDAPMLEVVAMLARDAALFLLGGGSNESCDSCPESGCQEMVLTDVEDLVRPLRLPTVRSKSSDK